jgi:hypothetical protein
VTDPPSSRSGRSYRPLAPAPLALALTAALALALTLIAAPAGAATYQLRPNATLQQDAGWGVTPSSMTADQVLAAPVLQPAGPSTTGPSLAATSGSGNFTIVGVPAPALAANETVTGATVWVYASTGTSRPLQLSLQSGSTALAKATIGAGKEAGWASATASGPLTAAQAGQLSIALQSQGGSGNATATTVYAAYLELSTSGAQTSGAGGGSNGGGASGGGATVPLADLPPSLAPPDIAAPSNPVPLPAAARTISVVLHCPAAAVTGCHGTVTLRFGARNAQLIAFAARCGRGCRTIGSGNFNIAAGKSKRVKVHMSVSTRRLFGHHRAVAVSETTTVRTGSGRLLSNTAIVVLTRPA